MFLRFLCSFSSSLQFSIYKKGASLSWEHDSDGGGMVFSDYDTTTGCLTLDQDRLD